jgi:hypothetical protein
MKLLPASTLSQHCLHISTMSTKKEKTSFTAKPTKSRATNVGFID